MTSVPSPCSFFYVFYADRYYHAVMPRAKKPVPLPPEVDRIVYYRQNPDGTYSEIQGGIDVGQGIQATPPSPVPVGPSPAVLELQSDIVLLVRERSGYRKLVADIQAELFAAQAKFQATQGRLSQFEQEIGERINLIAQLENRAPQINYSQAPEQGNVYPIGGALTGISSEPTRQMVQDKMNAMGDPSDMVNRGHAAAIRASL